MGMLLPNMQALVLMHGQTLSEVDTNQMVFMKDQMLTSLLFGSHTLPNDRRVEGLCAINRNIMEGE